MELAMPLITVWPLSWSTVTRNDGSSWASRASATPIFSWSALVLGSTATSMTGSGNSIRSRMIGCRRRTACRPWSCI